MSLLEAGFLPLQGILNTCIYLFTSGIYRDILHVFWRRRLYRSLYAASVDFAVPPQYDSDDDSDDAGAPTTHLHRLRVVYLLPFHSRTLALTNRLPVSAGKIQGLVVSHD
jgi:hypothetical protein